MLLCCLAAEKIAQSFSNTLCTCLMIMGKQKRTTNGILNIIQRFPYCEVMEAVIQTQNRIEIGMIGGINANGGANKNPLKYGICQWADSYLQLPSQDATFQMDPAVLYYG